MSQPQEKSEFAQFLEAVPVTPAQQTKSEFAQFLEQGQSETAQSDMERQREIAAGAVNLYRPANKDMAESRDIYLRQRGKEITGPEAMVVRGGNAATLGALSAIDPNTRDAVRVAGEDQPGWSMAGDIAGFAGTGGTVVANAGMRLVPKTGLGKFVGLGALGGAENAVYEATVGESNRQAAGESEGTAPERLNALAEGGTNPLAWAAGPAFYGAGRATGLIKAPPSENALALASVLDATSGTPVSSDDLRIVERFLRDQGITLNNEGFAALSGATENALELGAVGPRLPVRFKDLVSEAFPDSADGIVDHLRGTSQLRRGGHSIVDDAVSEDLGQSKEYLTETIQDTLGRQSRLGAEDQSREVLSQIGQEGYEPLLKAGPTNEAGAEALEGILEGPGMSKLYEPLRTIAAGEGKDLDFLLSEEPLAAAHWMQSKARQLSQRGGDEALRGGFGSLRTRLLNGLNAATDGQYDVIRRQYGDEYGNLEALEFGKSFLRDAHKPYELDVMKRSFEGLSEQQQQQALLSVRDTLLSAIGRGQATNGPRLRQVKEDNVLGALTRVFGDKGDEVRKLIEETRDFVTSRNNASRYASDTGRNMSAKDIALENVQPTWRRQLGQSISDLGSDAGLSIAFGQAVPFQTIQRQTQRLGKWIGGNPEDKLEALARVLEAPVAPARTNALAPTPSVPPAAAPAVNALAPQSSPAPAALPQRVAPTDERLARAREQGFNTDVTLYHGTARDFDSFDPFAPSQTKSGSAGSEGQGIFMTDSPKTAEAYARRSGFRHGDEPPGVRREAYEKTFAAEEAFFPWTKKRREAEAMKAWAKLTSERELDGGAKIIPAYVRLKNPLVVDDMQTFTKERMKEVIAKAKSAGHDGVQVRGIFDEWGGETQNYTIVFDPENVRSKYANFDPSRSNKSGLSD
ncbi:MAG: hypothetical protein AAFO74_13045 [Pseudomonadota bacterium]